MSHSRVILYDSGLFKCLWGFDEFDNGERMAVFTDNETKAIHCNSIHIYITSEQQNVNKVNRMRAHEASSHVAYHHHNVYFDIYSFFVQSSIIRIISLALEDAAHKINDCTPRIAWLTQKWHMFVFMSVVFPHLWKWWCYRLNN